MEKRKSGLKTNLICYYGVLQTAHLIVLIRAGLILLFSETYPFPILPPPAGWQPQTLPFLYGLGLTDTIGIIIGIVFAYRAVIKKKVNLRSGILSLTIFITGAVVFGAGTFPSGAWTAHPVAYWVMVGLFTPVPILYLLLLSAQINRNQHI